MFSLNTIWILNFVTTLNYILILIINIVRFRFAVYKIDKDVTSISLWSFLIATGVIIDKLGALLFSEQGGLYLAVSGFNCFIVCFSLVPLLLSQAKLEQALNKFALRQVISKKFYNLHYEGVLIGLKSLESGLEPNYKLLDCNFALCKLTGKNKTEILNSIETIFDSNTLKNISLAISNNNSKAVFNGQIISENNKPIPIELSVQQYKLGKDEYFTVSVISLRDSELIATIKQQNLVALEKQVSELEDYQSFRKLLDNYGTESSDSLANVNKLLKTTDTDLKELVFDVDKGLTTLLLNGNNLTNKSGK